MVNQLEWTVNAINTDSDTDCTDTEDSPEGNSTDHELHDEDT